MPCLRDFSEAGGILPPQLWNPTAVGFLSFTEGFFLFYLLNLDEVR
jgi:hypothetical protein